MDFCVLVLRTLRETTLAQLIQINVDEPDLAGFGVLSFDEPFCLEDKKMDQIVNNGRVKPLNCYSEETLLVIFFASSS